MTTTAGPRAPICEISSTHRSWSCRSAAARVEVAGDIEAEREAEDLAAGEPLQRVLGRVLLPQAELRPQHVGERAVGDAPAVGEAAAEPKRRAVRQMLAELANQARLPHARLTHDLHQARPPVRPGTRDRVLEPAKLVLPADEARFEPVPAARPPWRDHPQELPARDAARLPLGLDHPRLAELEGAADKGRGALPHERVAGLGCLLEARGHVHGVAGGEGAALAGPADGDLAGVDADPEGEPAAEELRQPLLHPEANLERSLAVVLLGCGRAEHGDDRIADELLDRPAAERDLGLHRVVEAIEQVARMLRVERRAHLGRADEVGEEDRRELALHVASISSTSHKAQDGAEAAFPISS